MGRKRWTNAEPSKDGQLTPQLLESVLRHYAEFRELFETQGIEEIPLGNGLVLNINDLLDGIKDLPKRQRTALILTTLLNLKEVEAAPLLGFTRWTSPVSSYKQIALRKLTDRWNNQIAMERADD